MYILVYELFLQQTLAKFGKAVSMFVLSISLRSGSTDGQKVGAVGILICSKGATSDIYYRATNINILINKSNI